MSIPRYSVIFALFLAALSPALPAAAPTATDSSSVRPASAGLAVQASISAPLSGATFHVFAPPYQAKRVYSDISQVRASSPEELMESIASEVTQEWVDSNWMKHISNRVSPEAFAVRKARDREKNYYELIHKLTFSHDGVETAIVKYWFVDDGKRSIVTAIQIQKIGDRWFGAAVPGLEYLVSIVGKLKPDVLAALLPTRPQHDPLVRDVFSKTRDPSGGLDFTKLHAYLTNLVEKKEFDTLSALLDRNNP